MGVASCSGGPGPDPIPGLGEAVRSPQGPRRRSRVCGGGSDTLGLAGAAASPKCFAGKLLGLAVLRTDSTGFLLTVIKSLANGLGRKKSRDEDLC